MKSLNEIERLKIKVKLVKFMEKFNPKMSYKTAIEYNSKMKVICPPNVILKDMKDYKSY